MSLFHDCSFLDIDWWVLCAYYVSLCERNSIKAYWEIGLRLFSSERLGSLFSPSKSYLGSLISSVMAGRISPDGDSHKHRIQCFHFCTHPSFLQSSQPFSHHWLNAFYVPQRRQRLIRTHMWLQGAENIEGSVLEEIRHKIFTKIFLM